MSVASELEKLNQLRETGAINEDEYAAAKARLLGGSPPLLSAGGTGSIAEERDTRLWGMILHLSLFAGYLVPFAGFVAPIVIWQVKKNELPGIDPHGKNAVNWIISSIIYAVVSAILIVVHIGFVLLAILGILGIVFPIIAAIKANNGEVWKYPLSIPFFK
jgi:uncharacterized Tic20 family protein